MNSILLTALQIPLIVLLADLLSGFVHWLEDSYFKETTPIVGPLVIAPNVLHHRSPRHFIKGSFWFRNSTTIIPSAIAFAIGTVVCGFHWQFALFWAAVSLSNELHCWAHRSPRENGPVIAFLHARGWVQTPAHHAVHHTDPKNRAYCTLTNLLNPILDGLEIWRRLEKVIQITFGIKTRPDPTVDPSRAARTHQKEKSKATHFPRAKAILCANCQHRQNGQCTRRHAITQTTKSRIVDGREGSMATAAGSRSFASIR